MSIRHLATRALATTALVTALVTVALGPRAALAQDDSPSSYCDRGFSLADTNRDDIITEEEVAAASDAEFDAIDADGDGTITPEEFAACRGAWLTHATAPDSALMDELAAIDRDRSGTASREEFVGAAVSEGELAPNMDLPQIVLNPPGGGEPRAMPREEAANRAAMMFLLMDANRDETVDAKEWAEQRSLNADIADIINMDFSATDVDASGDLTREEYQAGAQRRLEAARARAEAAGEGSDVGAPVVYYVYPHPM